MNEKITATIKLAIIDETLLGILYSLEEDDVAPNESLSEDDFRSFESDYLGKTVWDYCTERNPDEPVEQLYLAAERMVQEKYSWLKDKVLLKDLVPGQTYIEHLLEEPDDELLEVIIIKNEYDKEGDDKVIVAYLKGAFLINDNALENLLNFKDAAAITEFMEHIDVEDYRNGFYEKWGFCEEGLMFYDSSEIENGDEYTIKQAFCGKIQYTKD